MNVAFIGPRPVFDYLLETYYHLSLPWTIEWYKEVVDPTSFIILDNGAAEGRAIGGGRLVALADKYEVDEIVLPDRIRDKRATTRMVKEFMQTYGDVTRHLSKMGVVQGEEMREFQSCASILVEQGVQTIGVPRHMNDTLLDKWGRVKFLEWFFEHFSEVSVHCLGASDWVTEVRVLSEFPVRGMDTSLPVVAALEHTPIQSLTHRLDRRADFFNVPELDMAAVGYLTSNQIQFLRWANGNH